MDELALRRPIVIFWMVVGRVPVVGVKTNRTADGYRKGERALIVNRYSRTTTRIALVDVEPEEARASLTTVVSDDVVDDERSLSFWSDPVPTTMTSSPVTKSRMRPKRRPRE